MPPKKWARQHWNKRQRTDAPQERAGTATNHAGKNDASNNGGVQEPRRVSPMSIGAVRGHQIIVGTCDVRHDRQATAELIDVLNDVAEEAFPRIGISGSVYAACSTDSTPSTDMTRDAELSIEEMVQREAQTMRADKGQTRRLVSVNTSVKGVVMVCIMDKGIEAVRLVDSLFDDIRTARQRRTRFLERVTPITVTSYSDVDIFQAAARPMVATALLPVAQDVLDSVRSAKPSESAGDDATLPENKRGSRDTNFVKQSDSVKGICRDSAKGAGKSRDYSSTTDPRSETENVLSPKESCSIARETGPVTAEDVPDSPGQQRSILSATESSDTGQQATGDAELRAATTDKRWKFRVDVRRRHCALKRLDLINAVAGSVGEGHIVSMTSPDVTIVVEGVKAIVGTSVLFNYAKNYEYSISRLQDAVCEDILSKP